MSSLPPPTRPSTLVSVNSMIESALDQSESEDVRQRCRAIAALSQHAERPIVKERLLQMVDDVASDVRYAVVRALDGQTDAQAISALRKLADDDNEAVASAALTAIKSPSTPPAA